ncbi:hypothetical protein H0H93_011067 [Arthromyces matolae]|nr:hypothetical protein H0H93_011067 [Arthromyces matolae]
MREVILTDEQRAAIESWEEEMWESNSSNLERHNQGVTRAVIRGQREGKDPSKVADAYRLKGMNDNRSRKLQKSSGRVRSERGRRRIASDPKKIEGWEAKLKEDEVRYRKYMRGMERVRQENKEGVDVEKAVFKYRDDHYKQAQRNAKMLKEIREKRKDVQWGTSGNRSESQLVTTHGQDTPATPSAPPTPHTQNEHQHPEEGNEGDEELRMAFDFQSDTD